MSAAERVELRDSLLSFLRSPQYKPPVLPAVALELTNLTRRGSVGYEEVIGVLERDPLLVASVLKLAQSPLYGGRAHAQSLHDALNRLGINTLRDMVWQVLVGMRIFRVQGYAATMERIQAHSTFTAHAARVVASAAGIAAEHAFLCGLLHDVGWSGTLILVSERVPDPPSPESLFAVTDQMHAETGAAMAGLWGLAPQIVDVLRHHHERDQPARPNPLVHVMCVAEQLADEFDFAIESAASRDQQAHRVDENLVGRFENALTSLQLGQKLDGIRRNAEQIAKRLRTLGQ